MKHIIDPQFDVFIKSLITTAPDAIIRIKIDGVFATLPSKKTAWKTVGHAKSALKNAVTSEFHYQMRKVLGDQVDPNLYTYIEDKYLELLQSGRVQFVSVKETPMLNVTKGTWSVSSFDRRCVVDIDGAVIADIRTWRDTNDAKAIAKVPEMLNILESFSGSEGNWADEWLNKLAASCDLLLSKIKE